MDIKTLLTQAKEIQNTLKDKTQKFNKKTFTIRSQDIEIKMTGDKKIQDLIIPEKYLSDKVMLKDLLMVAFNEAINTVTNDFKKVVSKEIGDVPPELM